MPNRWTRLNRVVKLRLAACAALAVLCASRARAADLETEFMTPPEAAKPWVYWYFMDGNSSRPGMTADLESWKKAGIGGGIFLEVNIGVPRGPVNFMSPEWQKNFVYGVREADRIGVQIAVGSGPGWCGTGGPWVKPEQSMQHLVASATDVTGPKRFAGKLPQPKPREPFFGLGSIPGELRKEWESFYSDVAVVAFPTPVGSAPLADTGETALYHRAPFTSGTVVPFLPAPSIFPEADPDTTIPTKGVIDLTTKLRPDGSLDWQVPAGNWTVLRFGRTSTGQGTRPAPDPGLGFETDKFDVAALDAHFKAFSGKLIGQLGKLRPGRGLTGLHFDSWEMSSQNWSKNFRQNFTKLRGYDPLPYLPAMTGRTVGSPETTARFLWDLRQTTQELIYSNHVGHLRELAKRSGLNFSSEPYDMHPGADLYVGSLADIPMCEFWSKGFGYNSEYSCFEATSIGHVMGRPIVGAEAFTSDGGEAWKQYPGSMKQQGDWALATGINRITFHRFQHQPEPTQAPGIAMGPYGVHWERTQTWWDMVPAYHAYLARASYLLQQGTTVADVLYLTPEGAPHVFRPPPSATWGRWLDRRGYNFDGVDAHVLIDRATVKDGRVAFEGGSSYRLLVLPHMDTMTPKLLAKIQQLVNDGATVLGAAPRTSPSLADYPAGDEQLAKMTADLWGDKPTGEDRKIGLGLLVPDQLPAVAPGATSGTAARWIWFNEGNPASSAPGGTRYFQCKVQIDDASAVKFAKFWMTADNSFELKVNGAAAGSGNNFHDRPSFDVAALLKTGENVITVSAVNDDAGPAGLIGALQVETKDGKKTDVPTDAQWQSSLKPDDGWSAALDLGASTMGPWNLITTSYDVYPDYSTTAAVLGRLKVLPDFESDVPLRYTHRREASTDLYFVGNTDEQPVKTNARFRVVGRQPEWWNPLTGARRDLPAFTIKDGVTEIPLALDSLESGFVVFRKPITVTSGTGENFETVASLQPIAGAWSVKFDPKFGGPDAAVEFETLEDWSKRAEPQIRYYSGKAVYTTKFDVATPPAGKSYVALGTVANMASVKLNGKDLGVAWCAPWRVEVPPGTLKPTGNVLEVTVANLWVNRLIGDAGKPQKDRVTFTTYNPYQPDTALLPSGLLGPVELVAPRPAKAE